MQFIRRVFAPAPPIARLPEDEIKRQYPRYRWRIMEATYIGYAAFYLVRNNLSVVAKDIEGALNYSHTDMGSLIAISALSYGFGKFLMGALSDRSNPRVFMAFGLLISAILNLVFGGIVNFHVHLALWAMNGVVQGMGWPPCGRSMGHWYSERERGFTFSIWNTATNVGGGLAGFVAATAAHRFGGWQYAFYVPGMLSLIGSVYLFLRLRDTPQSVGLPPIEEYNNDYPANHNSDHAERELGFRELFVDSVLMNKYVWLLAFANFFVYITRYSMLDWGPMYLREVKHASLTGGGVGVLALEFGGIPSTILLGWLSDKVGGRRGMVSVFSLIPILAAFVAILFIPAEYLWLNLVMLMLIGLFIYPVIAFVVIIALDLTGKKAIGTAAGFIGLFGYLGRTVQAKGFGWMLDHFTPILGLEKAWALVIGTILACAVMAIVLLSFTWRVKPRA